MTQIIKSIGIVLLLLTVQTIACQNNDKKLISNVFNNYKTAILNDKGEEAVKYVDQRTIKYYNDMLDLVKNADSAKVEKLSMLDKLMVLAIRHRTSKEEILKFEGRSLLIYAINSGMVGKNSVSNQNVGDITINDSFAKGQFISSGQKTPFFFHFYKANSEWKIDLTSLFPISNMALKKMVETYGANETSYILSMLKMVTGKEPDSKIWQPVRE